MFNYHNAFSSFSVNDLQKAKNFYINTFGLTVEEDSMGILLLHIKDSSPIVVYEKPDHEAASFTVLNFSVDDIEKQVNEFIDKGISFEQYDGDIKTNEKGICRNEHGPSIAWFKDPAGNIISLIEERQ